MSETLTIDPAHVSDDDWRDLRAFFDAARERGEVVEFRTRLELLTPNEVARRLGMSRSTVLRRIADGDLHATKVGTHHRIPLGELERYSHELDRRMAEPSAEDIEGELLGEPAKSSVSDPGVVQLRPGVEIDGAALVAFAVSHGIRRLAAFGSVLRADFGPESDIDLLVEFQPGRIPGLLVIAAMELELGALLGREVELRTYGDLSRYFRDEVRTNARELYAA